MVVMSGDAVGDDCQCTVSQCVFHTTHVIHMHITQREVSALVKANVDMWTCS